MANKVIPKTQERLMDGTISYPSDVIKTALVRGYTGYAAGHATLADITGNGGTLGPTDTLAGKGIATNGNVTTLSCNAGSFGSPVAGAAYNHQIVYKDTGNATTSYLIVVDDSGTNLPVTPNGGPINYSFPNGVASFTSA
jgi:hypothetical protein